MYPKIPVITSNSVANTNRCIEKSIITKRNKLKVTKAPKILAGTEFDFRKDFTDAPKIIKMNAATIKNHAFRASLPTKRKPSNSK